MITGVSEAEQGVKNLLNRAGLIAEEIIQTLEIPHL